jgi:hypothetical protein
MSVMGKKCVIGVVATWVALVLCAPAHADNGQDRKFLAALTSAGWSIDNASGLTTQGRKVCVEGLAHGVSWQEMHSTLMGYGYSSLDSSTLIVEAVSAYCPHRQSAIADMDPDTRTAEPSPRTTGEWWDTPSQGEAVCAVVEALGRDRTVNYGIGDFNRTPEGAHFVDALIAKYCPQYAE